MVLLIYKFVINISYKFCLKVILQTSLFTESYHGLSYLLPWGLSKQNPL